MFSKGKCGDGILLGALTIEILPNSSPNNLTNIIILSYNIIEYI